MRSTRAVIDLKNVQLPSVWTEDVVLSVLSPCVCVYLSLWFHVGKVKAQSDSMEAVANLIITEHLWPASVSQSHSSLIIRVFMILFFIFCAVMQFPFIWKLGRPYRRKLIIPISSEAVTWKWMCCWVEKKKTFNHFCLSLLCLQAT